MGPVICEKDLRSDIPPVDKRKYLIPMDLTVGQFVYVIRKRISIPSDKAIFIFVNNTLPPTAALMSAVYEQHRDEVRTTTRHPRPHTHPTPPVTHVTPVNHLSHACNASQRRCSFSAAPAPTGRLHVYDVLWGEYLRKLGCGNGGGGDGGGGGGGPCGGRFRLDYENTTTALMCAVRVGSPPAPSLSFFVE